MSKRAVKHVPEKGKISREEATAVAKRVRASKGYLVNKVTTKDTITVSDTATGRKEVWFAYKTKSEHSANSMPAKQKRK